MSGLTEFEALTTLLAGPDAFQARMQRENVRDFDRLPRNRKGYPNDDQVEIESKALAERIGFVFGDIIDDLFVAVTPPEGWGLRPTDHYLWTDLVDGQDRKRGIQCYKAAAYDRDAFYHFNTRYAIKETRPENWFELSHPTQPEPLFKTVRKEVLVEAGDDRARSYDYDDGYGHVFFRGPRYEMKDVKVYLPESKQPKPIIPQGYTMAIDVIDQATGDSMFKGESFYAPVREENPTYYAVIEDHSTAGRVAAAAWLDEKFPEWRDPAAYWNSK